MRFLRDEVLQLFHPKLRVQVFEGGYGTWHVGAPTKGGGVILQRVIMSQHTFPTDISGNTTMCMFVFGRTCNHGMGSSKIILLAIRV